MHCFSIAKKRRNNKRKNPDVKEKCVQNGFTTTIVMSDACAQKCISGLCNTEANLANDDNNIFAKMKLPMKIF